MQRPRRRAGTRPRRSSSAKRRWVARPWARFVEGAVASRVAAGRSSTTAAIPTGPMKELERKLGRTAAVVLGRGAASFESFSLARRQAARSAGPFGVGEGLDDLVGGQRDRGLGSRPGRPSSLATGCSASSIPRASARPGPARGRLAVPGLVRVDPDPRLRAERLAHRPHLATSSPAPSFSLKVPKPAEDQRSRMVGHGLRLGGDQGRVASHRLGGFSAPSGFRRGSPRASRPGRAGRPRPLPAAGGDRACWRSPARPRRWRSAPGGRRAHRRGRGRRVTADLPADRLDLCPTALSPRSASGTASPRPTWPESSKNSRSSTISRRSRAPLAVT